MRGRIVKASPMSPETQAGFAAALLDPSRPAAQAVRDPRRFAVWRNNVVVGLSEALEATYPAVRALVGEDFFRAAAREYLRAHPPRTPVLLWWGGAFAAFLDAFPPARSVAYLGDVARLEWARREAYHAADAAPLGVEALAGLAPEALERTRLAPHPALRLVASRYPLVALWAETTGRAPPSALDLKQSQTALVVRPLDAVDTSAPAPATAAFLRAVAAGRTLGEAAQAGAAAGAFDLAAAIAGLFAAGCVAGVRAPRG